jgi:hypothetical protein
MGNVAASNRAPPESGVDRQERLMIEIVERFDRLGKLGKEITDLNRRRVTIETRLNDPLLLQNYPPGGEHHDQALQRLEHVREHIHQRTWELLANADAVAERLKRLDDDAYRTMLGRVGSGWKGEPVWNVVRTLPQCQGSPQWQDLIWAERIAEDGHAPF